MKTTEQNRTGSGRHRFDVVGQTFPVRSRRLQKFICLGDSVFATVLPKHKSRRERKINNEPMEETRVWTLASTDLQFTGWEKSREKRETLSSQKRLMGCSSDPDFTSQPMDHITECTLGAECMDWCSSPATPETGPRSTIRNPTTHLVKPETASQSHLPFQCPTIQTISNGCTTESQQQRFLESAVTMFQEDKQSEVEHISEQNDRGERKEEEDEEEDGRRKQCCDCCKSFVAFLFSTVGLSCLMVGYVILGGLLFRSLEAPNEMRIYGEMRKTRRFHVDRLWQITEAMNVLHPTNWSTMAEKILENYTSVVYYFAKKRGWDGKDDEDEEQLQWSFAGALLYSITVVTTIGYGHIAPKTEWGRIVTMLYAIVGIPLTLLTITNLGGFMATAFRFLYQNVCCRLFCLCCCCCSSSSSSSRPPGPRRRRNPVDRRRLNGKAPPLPPVFPRNKSAAALRRGEAARNRLLSGTIARETVVAEEKNARRRRSCDRSGLVPFRGRLSRVLSMNDLDKVTVPIYISLLLIAGYIAIGALMFTLWEDDWNYLIGCYFCFITLSTIGFGDYVPGTSLDAWNSQEKLVMCALYLVFGLALLAMCFDLMQEEARQAFKVIGRKMGLIDDEEQ